MARIEQSIEVEVPLSTAYNQWTQFEEFPQFMDGVEEVRQLDDTHLHWVAAFGGQRHEWDAEVTESISNKLLAWRSVPGSTVETEGVVRFEPHGNGGTRVTIHMTYKPPAGVLGHCITALFGANPKSEIDDDMVRLKSLMERGSTSAHGAKVDKKSLGLRGTQPA